VVFLETPLELRTSLLNSLILFLSVICLNRVAVPVLENQSARQETRLVLVVGGAATFLFMHLQWLRSLRPAQCASLSAPFCWVLLGSVRFCSFLIFQKVLGRLAVGLAVSPPHPLVILAMINDAFCCDSF